MLELIKFDFAYPGQKKLLKSTNLKIEKGEKIALLGYNGVGKSSIIKGIWEKFIIDDQTVNCSEKIAYLPQNIPNIDFDIDKENKFIDYYQLFYKWQSMENREASLYSNFDELLFYWSINALPDKRFEKRLQSNLFDLRISTGLIANNFKLLSPGTKKKILLAILFATNPDVMIIDELTNHLDRDSIETVSGWMKAYQGSVLLVDHNSEFLNRNIRNFLFLPNNEDRELEKYYNVSYDEFLVSYEEKQIRQINEVRQVEKREVQLRKQLKHLQFRAEVFDSDIGALARSIKKKLKNEVYGSQVYKNQDLRKTVSFLGQENKSKIKKSNLITIKNLQFVIGQNKIQTIEEFKLYQGSRVWIKGGNGKGKSSMMNIICDSIEGGLQENAQYLYGDVIIGESLASNEYFILKQNTNYGDGITIIDFTLKSFKLEWFEINSILKKIGLGEKFNFESNISHLSLGEFTRYQLALIAQNLDSIKLILLDEPGNFLDVFTQKALTDMIKNFNGSLLYITHDESLGEKFNPSDTYILN